MSNRPSRKRKSPSKTEIKRPFQFRRNSYWTDKEIFCLTLGLQRYGFSETKKISELVKTKNENAVKHYLNAEVAKVRYNILREKCLPKGVSWYHPCPEEVKSWPVIRKWRRLLYNQLLPCVRAQDYSKIVMEDLLQSFYEEAEEPSDPQLANFKAIYKYLLDCFCGRVPAELSPIDSAIILMLIGVTGEMQSESNFSEEKKFLRNFKKAKTFAPMKIKSEFKERTKKRSKILGNTLKAKLSSSGKLNPRSVPKTSHSSTVNSEEAIPGTSRNSKTIQNVSRLFNIKLEPTESEEELSNIQSEAIHDISQLSRVKVENDQNSSEVPEVASEVVVSTVTISEQEETESECEDTKSGAVEENFDEENTIRIPEEIYVNLSKHRKVVQSFNPLNVPMWTLVTQQARLQNRCEMATRSEP